MAAPQPSTAALAALLAGEGVDGALREFRGVGIPGRVLAELLDGGTVDPLRASLFVASHPETPSRVLRDLYQTGCPEATAAELARHPRLPKELMLELTRHPAPAVRLALADNRFLTPQAAATLAEDGDILVREALAGNPALSLRQVALLARDPADVVRMAVARRAQLEQPILQALSEDDNLLVRATAILGKAPSEITLLGWADSDSLPTQALLLRRPGLPDKVVESLCFSKHQSVQLRALAGRQLGDDEMLGWAHGQSVVLRQQVAGMAGLAVPVQQLLAADPDPGVRARLAGNDSLDGAVATTLANDPDVSVLAPLCANPALTEATLDTLCRHPNLAVRRLLCRRPRLAPAHLATLVGDGDPVLVHDLATNHVAFPELAAPAAEALAGHPLPSLRAFAAIAETLSDATLRRLAGDDAPAVRLAVASHRNPPLAVLWLLASDPHREVARLANHRLRTPQTAAETPAETLAPNTKKPKQILQRLLKNIFGKD